MAAGDRELKLRLALEYDPAGYGQFQADVASVQAAAGVASGDLGALAVSITSVGEAAGGVGDSLSGVSEGAASLEAGASGAETLSGALDAAAGSAEGAAGSLEATGAGADAAASSVEAMAGSTEAAAAAGEALSQGQQAAAAAVEQLSAAASRVGSLVLEAAAAVATYGSGSAQAVEATKALAAAQDELVAASVKAAEGLAQTQTQATGLGDKMNVVKGIVGGAAVAAALKLGNEFKKTMDGIQLKTGATGEQLDGLQQSFRNVFAKTGADAATTSGIIGVYASKLDLSGKELEDLTVKTLRFAKVTSQDAGAATEGVATLFQRWGVDTKDQAKALDDIFKASQAAGVGAGTLTAAVSANSATLKAAGLDLEHSVVLLGSLAKSGIEAGEVMPGLTRSLSNMAKNGVEPVQGLKDLFATIKEEGINSATAIETFGGRAGLKLAAAIGSGALATEEFAAQMAEIPLGVDAAAKATSTYGSKLTAFKHQITLLFEPIGSLATSVAGSLVGLASSMGSVGLGITDTITSWGVLKKLFSEGGAGAAVLTKAMSLLGIQGSASLGSIVLAAAPLLAVVAVLGLLYVAVQKGDAALSEQIGALDQSSASFDDYAQAVGRASQQSGILASIGTSLRGAQLRLKGDLAEATAGFHVAGEAAGMLWDALTGGDEAGTAAADGVEKTNEALKLSVTEIELAGEAWLKQGTNISPAVMASDQFVIAQSRLNAQLQDGKLTQEQYSQALLQAANSASQAAGEGAVLTNLQVQTRDAFLASSQAIATNGGTLSASTLASKEFTDKQAELAAAVARGTISAEAAKTQWGAFVAQLAAGDTEAQKAIAANAALAQGFETLKAGLAGGSISLDDAKAHLQELGAKAGATSEQLTKMAQDLEGLAVPEGFAELGFKLNTEALLDPEKMTKELEAGRDKLASSVAGIFQDQIEGRRKFQAAEAALAAERPAAIAKAEADVAAEIQKASAEGDSKKVADLQAGLAKEIAAINTGNAEKLTALQAGYAQETQARRDALAQAALDQVNSLLTLGKISEDQAFRIFGSLKKASPGSHLFSEEAAATIKFNSTLGQATQGSVEAADALGGLLTNIEGEANASVAAVEAREQRGIAAVQATDAVVVESADVRSGAYQRQTAAAAEAADSDDSSNQVRVNSTLSTDAVLQASTEARVAMRGTEVQASVESTDSLTADDERTVASVAAASGEVTSEHARMIEARQDAAAASRQSTEGMVQDTTRLSKGALAVGAAVDQSVGRIGGDFIRSGQGVRIGTGEIVAGTTDAKVALTGLGTDVPGSLAPASESIRQLGEDAAATGTRIAEAAHTRTEGEEDAASASVRAADDTTAGFVQIKEQSVETAAKVAGLRKELVALPRKVDIPFTVTGLDKGRAAIAQLAKDLKAATGVWTLKIQGSYTGPGPMKPGNSLQLQHDVEDALAAAEPGLHIAGSYTGAGAMAWRNGGLAITESVQAMAASAPERLLLFDPAADAEKLRPLLAEIVRTTAVLAELKRTAKDGAAVVKPALDGIRGALAAFFTSDPASGGLALILKQLKELGIELGADFFRNAGILDVANFQDLQAQLASLAGEPKRQEELWKTFIDGLTNRWKVYYDKQSTQLERQKAAQEALRKEALKANKDADTSAIDAEIERLDGLLDTLKAQNEDIDFILKEQTFNVGAQFDLYGRLLDAVEDRAKAEADAEKAREEAIKNAAELLKDLQASVKDAENDAHEQTMDLLEREQKARERAYKDQMARLDALAEATKADVAAQLKAEEDAHQRRLAAISSEADKKDAANQAEQALLDEAKAIIESIRAGNAITGEQASFLRSLGIDPDKVVETNEGLKETAAALDRIKTLLDKLPDEKGRVRARGGKLESEAGKQLAEVSQAEQDALQAALAGGKLSKKDRRIAEIFLAGGVVQSQRLREILEKQVTEEQTKITAAEKQRDLAGEILDQREKQLKVAEIEAEKIRKALQDQIDQETKRHDDAVAFQQARLDGIDAERDALRQRYDDEKEAIGEAKAAEEERHKARLRQIDEEYALQLLRLGKTDAEVLAALNEQKDRAAAIADEAQKRFEAILAEADARRKQEEAERKKREDEAAAQAAANSGSSVTRPEPPPPPTAPIQPGDPGFPIVPPPGGTPGGGPIPFGSVFGGFPDAASSVDAAMAGAMSDLKATAAETGLLMADRLFDPALEQLDVLMTRTAQLRDIFAGDPGLFGLAGGGDVSVDRRIVFNGPVTLDRELAEELGILDVARTGAP